MCALLLCSGVVLWFYANSWPEIDYTRHKVLIDPQTGAKMPPSALVDLGKVIKPTKEYINDTTAFDRLYDLAFQTNLENPFVIEHKYSEEHQLLVSGWPVADSRACGQQLEWIVQKLHTHKNYAHERGQVGYELTRFMDSFGRPESGAFAGSIHWMGSYKQCMRAHLNGGVIKPRYCIGRMVAKGWPSDSERRSPSIRMGMCLPETCDTKSFEQHAPLMSQLAKHELAQPFDGDNLALDNIFCLPDERSPIRQIPLAGRLYMCIVGCWILFVFAASIIYELVISNTRRRNKKIAASMATLDQQIVTKLDAASSYESSILMQILEAFSVRGAIKTFKSNVFRVRYNQGQRAPVDLSCLNGIKIIMAVLVVLAHASYLGSVFARSLGNKIEMGTHDLGRMALSLARCVDTFFVFFGLFTTYTLMRKLNERQLGNPLLWLGVIAGNLLRIGPIFMLIYWYSRTVSPYTGAGPWWDYGVDESSQKGVCMRDSWWKSIPYFGSLGSPAVPSCLLPGWFIVSYIQLSLILPLITYVLCKLPNYLWRFALIAFLSLASATNIGYRLYIQTSVKEEAFTSYGSLLMNFLEKYESVGYMSTLGRLGSVSMGCFVGYLLRQYELGHIKQWPRWMRSRITLISLITLHVLFVCLPVIGYKLQLISGHMTTQAEFALFNIALIILWSVINALLTIISTTTYNRVVIARFFGHSFWNAFNKLGLCLYLVHWEVLYVSVTGTEQPPSHGFISDIITIWLYATLISIIISLVLFILVEVPFAKLTMIPARYFVLDHKQVEDARDEPNKTEHIASTDKDVQVYVSQQSRLEQSRGTIDVVRLEIRRPSEASVSHYDQIVCA